jgi:lipoprotein Spr
MYHFRKYGFLALLATLMFVQAAARPVHKPALHHKVSHAKSQASHKGKPVAKSATKAKPVVASQALQPQILAERPILKAIDNKPVPARETERAITVVTVSDRKPANNAWSVNNDLLLARTTQKPVMPITAASEVKKEEPSIASSVMDWVKDKYATMIEVLPNQISNVMLYRFIDDWYGVKYRMGGSTKKGVDCSAFVQNLYKYVFGMDLVRTACMQFNTSKLIMDPCDLKEGDLVFFKVNSSRISHVGVYLRNNFFVHSASSQGVSIASLTSAYWSKYFAGGGRILNN